MASYIFRRQPKIFNINIIDEMFNILKILKKMWDGSNMY